jgi:hypothetical protein
MYSTKHWTTLRDDWPEVILFLSDPEAQEPSVCVLSPPVNATTVCS